MGTQGPGYWKFNASFLNDENFVEEMTSKLQEWLQEDLEVITKWEYIKMKTRDFCKKYGKIKANSRTIKLQALEKKLWL